MKLYSSILLSLFLTGCIHPAPTPPPPTPIPPVPAYQPPVPPKRMSIDGISPIAYHPGLKARKTASSLVPSLKTAALKTLTPSSSVLLAWDSVTGVNGYNLYWGTASQTYTNHVSTTASNAVVRGLVVGNTYYFAATSTTSSGLESVYSAEVSYTVPPPTPPLTNVFITVQMTYATNVTGTYGPIGAPIVLTNPPSPLFFKPSITRTNY